MRRGLLLLLLVLASLPAPAQTPTPAQTPESSSLGETRSALDALKAKIDAATEKEAALLEALDEIEQEMASRAEELADIQKQIDTQRAASDEKRVRMELLTERIRGKRAWLKGRLRSIYIHGRPGYLKVLFAAESHADLVRRTKFSRIIARRDTELVAGLKVDLKEVAASRSDYDKDVALLENALSDSRSTNEELEIQRAFRQTLLDEVKSERVSFARLQEVLERQARELDKTVGGLTSTVPHAPARPFVDAKGRILPPLAKPTVLRPYGPYRHSTGAQMLHQGIVWSSPIGEPVKAVFDGRVEMAMWHKARGQVVVIDHGGGWKTLYAHNSALKKKKGDPVSEGEVIALTGDTGTFDEPGLFFAVYHDGKPVDPAEWFLKK